MKTILLTAAALLVPVTSALSFPFVARNTTRSLFQQDGQLLQAFQADRDRRLEVFSGAADLFQMSGGTPGEFTGDFQNLPFPDTDPYPPNFPITWGSGRGTTGDIDNDGDIDIVYTATLEYNFQPEKGNVRIVACLNDGNGGFTRKWQLKATPAPIPDVPEVRLADFDRDGDLDLLESSSGLVIRWNDGTGNFSTASPVLHGVYPAMPGYSMSPRFEVGDFDGNGWMDFALFVNVRLNADEARYSLTGRATVYYNQDGQNFVTSTFGQNSHGEEFLQSGTGDINGDGRPDVLAARYKSSGGIQLVWYRNTGSSFATGIILLDLTDEEEAGSIAFVPCDLDGDGRQDIVFGGRDGEVKWLHNAGSGTFDPVETIRSSTIPGEPSLGVADMDGDGDLDILTETGFVLLENTEPHLRSAAAATTYAGAALSGAVDLSTGDLNNDGLTDLIAADGGANRIRWYTANAQGLTEQVYVSTGSVSPLGVAAGDWNGDGWTDLAWSGNGVLRQAVSSNGSGIGWLFSDAATMAGVSGILSEDIDRDGDTDMLCASTSGVVRVFSNVGSGWVPQLVDASLPGVNRLTLGQPSPGGRLEIAALGATQIATWKFGASWTRGASLPQAAGNASRGICYANVSETLEGDELIFSLNANTVYLYHRDLSGVQTLATLSYPVVQLAPVDWNRDGYTDVLVTTASAIYLMVHQVSPDAAFEPTPVLLHALPAGKSFQDTAVLDMDRDSLPDAVTADSAGALHVLSNTSYAASSTLAAVTSRGSAPGGSLEVARFHGSYQSRVPGDAGLYPSRVYLSFNRAVGPAGSEVAGTPMTDAEVTALVDYTFLMGPATPVNRQYANGPLTPLGNGQLAAEGYGTSDGAMSGNFPEKDFILHLRLKSGAAGAPVTRFFVTVSSGIGWAGTSAADPGELRFVRARNDGSAQRTLFYIREASPLEQWRTQNFGGPDEYFLGEGRSANAGDYDADGYSNMMEYIMGLNPKVPGGIGSGPVVGLSYDAARGTYVADLRLLSLYDPRVKLTLQYSVDPSAGWGTVATRTGIGSWTGTPPYNTTGLSGGRIRYVFDKGLSPAAQPKAFYRLKAEELP